MNVMKWLSGLSLTSKGYVFAGVASPIIASLLLFGCGKKEAPPAPPADDTAAKKEACDKKTDGSKWNADTKKCDPAPAAADEGEPSAPEFSVTYDAGVFTFANVGTDLSLGAGEKTFKVDVFLNTETTATVSLTLGLDDDKTGVTLSAADADKDKLKEAVNGLADAAAKNAFTLKLQLKADGTNVEATVDGSSVTLENADAKVLAEKAGADLSGDGVNAAATDLTKLKEAVKGLVDAAA